VFIAVRRGTRGVIRTSFGAIAAAFMLAALLVLPVMASSGPTRLSDPNVSPSTGTTATTFVFTVKYQNHEGSAPDHVSVVIDGTSHLMTTTSTSWKQRATFSYSSKLSVGSHTVTFTSLDRDRFADSIVGGSVTVTAPPAPTPEPTAKPTPRPTPKPTPAPTPTPSERPAPTPRATPTTEPGSAATPTPSPAADPSGSTDGGSGGSDPGASPSDGPAASYAPPDPGDLPGSAWNGSVPPGPGSFGSGGEPPSGPGDGGASGAGEGRPGAISSGDGAGVAPGGAGQVGSDHGWGTLTAFTEILGLDSVSPPTLRLLPTLVGTTGGVAMTMAFLFFGKRRRDGEPPASDEVLAAAAARGSGVVAGSGLTHNGAVVPPAMLDPDAELPRWRRPSLLQARKADPLRNAVAVAPLSFDHGLVGPLDGRERRLIRYTAVTLRDAPDELRSAAIGSLTQGDEIQLLERSGTYWLVLCPDGRQGWIHKMTLGDVVGESPSPSASDTWAPDGAEADDVDDDVLSAFLAARGSSA
jgi:hypothetical protein